MDTIPQNTPTSRLGFHYYPDTLHYRENDLNTWLPELRALGISWLTLTAPVDRAIPETFLSGLTGAGIEPILQFRFPLVEPPSPASCSLLLESYARWGVNYVVFFDRPNARSSWPLAYWTQEDLVERFLDRYLPWAEAALNVGLTPVFPTLEPGGNYWDTSFLRAALYSLLRRKQEHVLQRLVLSAYAWTGDRSLNWGAGGPERWSGARPYSTPLNEEDQRGFRIFDWYLAITRSVLMQPLPIILFGAGFPSDPNTITGQAVDPSAHALQALTTAQMVAGETISDPENPDKAFDPVPPEVIACNYWLLAAAAESPYQSQAWYQADGRTLPAVGTLRQWNASREKGFATGKSAGRDDRHPISHYLLLPVYEWGVADWHLEIIRPFIKKYQPTIGFSIQEAEHAKKVTVINGPEKYPEDVLNHLRAVGCFVEEITGDGTSIATQLAER
jgi:hypothetical protein